MYIAAAAITKWKREFFLAFSSSAATWAACTNKRKHEQEQSASERSRRRWIEMVSAYLLDGSVDDGCRLLLLGLKTQACAPSMSEQSSLKGLSGRYRSIALLGLVGLVVLIAWNTRKTNHA
jgi:hypothetical protein